MKKAILLILTKTIIFNCLFAQTIENPFSKLGYDKKVMFTSSKGDYEEFHDNKDVVEIGTVYFNTKTKKVVGYVNEEKEKTDVATATSAMSIDPLCEQYYWISPYVYCANNPIRYIDPDGRKLVDANGNLIYTQSGGWTKHASTGAQRIGNAMMNNPVGQDMFNKLSSANYDVTLTLDPGTNGNKMGQAVTTAINGKIEKVDITLYGENIMSSKARIDKAQEKISKGARMKNPSDKQKAYVENASSVDDYIGAVGAHEAEHATNKAANGVFEPSLTKREAVADKKEIEYLKKTPEYRLDEMKPITPTVK